MNSSNGFSSNRMDQQKNEDIELLEKRTSFELTYDQYMIIQHHLPKKYALLEQKSTGSKSKRHSASHYQISNLNNNNSSHRLNNAGHSHVQSQLQEEKRSSLKSSYTNPVEGNSELESKSKRSRVKKVDRYLDEEPISSFKEQPKRTATLDKAHMDEEMLECSNILNSLKKHRSSHPFMEPVDPERDQVDNYFDIIKEPMDLGTVEKKLTSGEYASSAQFHADVRKIWQNSYLFNQKSQIVYKMAVEMDKYYKNLLTNDPGMGIRPTKSMVKAEKAKSKDKRRDSKHEDRKKKKSSNSKSSKAEPQSKSSKANEKENAAENDSHQKGEEDAGNEDNEGESGKGSNSNDDIDYDGYD